jgi:hypothetical protein
LLKSVGGGYNRPQTAKNLSFRWFLLEPSDLSVGILSSLKLNTTIEEKNISSITPLKTKAIFRQH